MSESIRRRRGVLAAAALAALALPTAALAGGAEEPPKAELATTGNDSELVRSVPIASSAGLKERVVMSLGPESLKRIEAGDRMRVSGEVQVSTTCVARGPRCVGRRYEFNPTISARIELAATPEAGGESIPLSESEQVLCKQRRPNRNHHCTLAFPNIETPVVDLDALPCPANDCHVNMVLGASNRNAQRGNRVVLGADLPDGGVKQDKGRLNVIQARSEVSAPVETATAALANSTLPLTEGKKVKRRVIHSIPVPAPLKGEVLAFDGSYVATIDELPFNTFISSRVILAAEPTGTDPSGLARSAVQLRGDATEANGFNCTQGPSGYPTPCTVEKAGAIRLTKDAVDEATGQPATLYLNLVASAKPLLAEKVKRAQQVTLGTAGGLRMARYSND
jgi:hypothetical protein